MMQSVSENKWTCLGEKKYRKSETQQASDMYKWSFDFLPLLTHFSILFSFLARRQCKLCFKVVPRLSPLKDCHLSAATWVAARQREREREQCGNCKWNCLTACHREWIMQQQREKRRKGETRPPQHAPWKCIKFSPTQAVPNKHEHDHVWQSLNEH